jgi:hypothetical protein
VIIFRLWCNGKNVFDFFSDHDKRLNFVIQKIFAKNKYCNTVKIYKKNAQTSFFFKVYR